MKHALGLIGIVLFVSPGLWADPVDSKTGHAGVMLASSLKDLPLKPVATVTQKAELMPEWMKPRVPGDELLPVFRNLLSVPAGTIPPKHVTVEVGKMGMFGNFQITKGFLSYDADVLTEIRMIMEGPNGYGLVSPKKIKILVEALTENYGPPTDIIRGDKEWVGNDVRMKLLGIVGNTLSIGVTLESCSAYNKAIAAAIEQSNAAKAELKRQGEAVPKDSL